MQAPDFWKLPHKDLEPGKWILPRLVETIGDLLGVFRKPRGNLRPSRGPVRTGSDHSGLFSPSKGLLRPIRPNYCL